MIRPARFAIKRQKSVKLLAVNHEAAAPGRLKAPAQPPRVLPAGEGAKLESDHVIHLLGHATESCRTSIHQVTELLKLWAKGASTAHSQFHTEKAGSAPAIKHASGETLGYEKVKHAVERDLKHAMKGQTAQSGQVTYSVHYSDINGLSRLENYILAKEIAEYLGEQSHCREYLTMH